MSQQTCTTIYPAVSPPRRHFCRFFNITEQTRISASYPGGKNNTVFGGKKMYWDGDTYIAAIIRDLLHRIKRADLTWTLVLLQPSTEYRTSCTVVTYESAMPCGLRQCIGSLMSLWLSLPAVIISCYLLEISCTSPVILPLYPHSSAADIWSTIEYRFHLLPVDTTSPPPPPAKENHD